MLKHSDLSGQIVDAAIAVHRELGPGLLESVYVTCLAHELQGRGLKVEREWSIPLRYRDLEIANAFRGREARTGYALIWPRRSLRARSRAVVLVVLELEAGSLDPPVPTEQWARNTRSISVIPVDPGELRDPL